MVTNGMIIDFAQSYQSTYQAIAIALGIMGVLLILGVRKHAKEILLFLGSSEAIAFLLYLVLPPLVLYEESTLVFFRDPSIVAFLDVVVVGAIFAGACCPVLWAQDHLRQKRARNRPVEWSFGACLVLGSFAMIPSLFANGIPMSSDLSPLAFCLGAVGACVAGLWYAYKHSEKMEDWVEDLLARRVPSLRGKPETERPLQPSIASLPACDPERVSMQKGDVCLGRVRVTLGPPIDADANQPPQAPMDPPKIRSFLQDFLPVRGHPKTYGVEIARDNGHTWAFFARARNPKEAQSLAAGILQRLKTEFPVLDGVADVIQLPKAALTQKVPLLELRLPRPPFRKVSLLDTLARMNAGSPFRVYIVFRKATQAESDRVRSRLDYGAPVDDAGPQTPHDAVELICAKQLVDAWKEDLFAARIFIQAEVSSLDQECGLRGSLQELLGHVENTREFHARARDERRGFSRMVSCAKQLDSDRFLAARVVDFDFPASMRMPRGWMDKDEPFTPIEGLRDDTPGYLILGNALQNGADSGQKLAIEVRHLSMHAVILGGTGKGKTRFLLYMLHKLWQQHHLPMVVINFAKEEHQHYFPHDRIFRFPEADFEIPYFVDPGLPLAKRKKYLSMAGSNIAYMLGLGEWELVPMTFRHVLRTKKVVPKTLVDLFGLVLAKLARRQYSQKTQADIMASVQNRMDDLRDRDLVRCTQLLAPGRLPKWFELWQAGKSVVLDISACGEEKALVFLCILLTFYAAVPLLDKDHQDIVRGLLVADEAQDLIGTSASKDPRSALYQMAARIGEVFDTFLREFRERGVGVMVVSQNIKTLPETAYDIPNLKILFQLDNESAAHFASSPQQVSIINALQARQAFVHNPQTGDKCYIRTPDFPLPAVNPKAPRKITPGARLTPVITALVPREPSSAQKVPLKELYQRVKRDRFVLDRRLAHSATQGAFRPRALRQEQRGHHHTAFNILYALWRNTGVVMLGKTGHPPGKLRSILRHLHKKSRPDSFLKPKEREAFYAAAETAWHLLRQAKRGGLQPGDVRAFDVALGRIFRDLEFCLARIEQRKSDAQEILPANAPPAKRLKHRAVERAATLAVPEKKIAPGPLPTLTNTAHTGSRAFLLWFQDSLRQQDANGAYFAVYAYWAPKLGSLSAHPITEDRRGSLSQLVENLLESTISTPRDPPVKESPVSTLLQDVCCIEEQIHAGTLEDTAENVAAIRGLFFALKDLFLYCMDEARGASSSA